MEKPPEEKKKEPASLDARREKTPGFSSRLPPGIKTARIFTHEEFERGLEKARWQRERKKLIEKYHLPLDATDKAIEAEERAERGAGLEAKAKWEKWRIDHGMD